MLGLGQSLTHDAVTEGLISLGGFTYLTASDFNDDENVQVVAGFGSQAMDDLLGFDGDNNASGDKQGGTLTLTVSRLDGSGDVVGGATSSGTVHAYRASSVAGHVPFGLVFISAADSSNLNVNTFTLEGSSLLNLSTFGGTDITGSATSSNYRFTLTVTGDGYTLESMVSANISLDKP